MSTKTKKTSTTGVRYSDAQKKQVVDFVVQYNSKNGRGGQSAASKKFKITPLTIAVWIKSVGVPTAAKKASKKVAKKAAAPKAKGSSKVGRGSRYTPEKKQEIVDFVIAYNAAHGRGGQSKAVAKYKLSAITCASWLKAAGVKAGKALPKKKGKAAKAVKQPGAAPSGLAAKVSALIEITSQVRKAETELEKLYAKQDSMMASLKV